MKNLFLKNRIKAFGFAFKGIFGLLKSEANFQVQMVIAMVMVVLGFIFQISTTEWLFQIFAIGLVLGFEAFNSAVEKLCDFIYPDFNKNIGKVKDFAAGGVLLATLTAIAIGLVIYWPYVF